MKKEQFEQLPYTSRKEIIELRKFCSDFLEMNAPTIYKDDNESVLHQFRDKTGKFAFNIRDPKINEAAGNNYYQVYYSPGSLTNNLGVTSQSNFEHIKKQINEWLGYIKKLHEATEEYYNPFEKFYDEEFHDFFVNDDEDASSAPYDLSRQEVLFYFLT